MKKRRVHPLNQSVLYAVRSKADLAEILFLPSRQALDALVKTGDAGYRTYFDKATERDIQYPLGMLKGCHERIKKILSRIEVPNYVHSQKGQSYVTNAQAHAIGAPVIKTDITKYFPTTTFSHVHRFFKDDMKCSPDVAWYLAKLCTFDSHIPTGSTLSNPLSFFANRPLFDSVYAHAKSRGCAMTLLQDDITISGPSASKKLLGECLMMIRRHGLQGNQKRKKTKTYPASAIKVVTGVVIKGASITLPNRRRKKLADAAKAVRINTGQERAAAKSELRGRITEADQIDSSAVDSRFRRLV